MKVSIRILKVQNFFFKGISTIRIYQFAWKVPYRFKRSIQVLTQQ